MDLQRKTVVVTGASRGIGEAAARAFSEAGANVVLLARSGDAIGRIARDIGDKALAVTCDVSSWSQVKAAVDQTVWRFKVNKKTLRQDGKFTLPSFKRDPTLPLSSLASDGKSLWTVSEGGGKREMGVLWRHLLPEAS